jgi:hypothetical protein
VKPQFNRGRLPAAASEAGWRGRVGGAAWPAFAIGALRIPLGILGVPHASSGMPGSEMERVEVSGRSEPTDDHGCHHIKGWIYFSKDQDASLPVSVHERAWSGCCPRRASGGSAPSVRSGGSAAVAPGFGSRCPHGCPERRGARIVAVASAGSKHRAMGSICPCAGPQRRLSMLPCPPLPHSGSPRKMQCLVPRRLSVWTVVVHGTASAGSRGFVRGAYGGLGAESMYLQGGGARSASSKVPRPCARRWQHHRSHPTRQARCERGGADPRLTEGDHLGKDRWRMRRLQRAR